MEAVLRCWVLPAAQRENNAQKLAAMAMNQIDH
jgi:hypothetical protein